MAAVVGGEVLPQPPGYPTTLPSSFSSTWHEFLHLLIRNKRFLRAQVMAAVVGGEVLPQPPGCPNELYGLMRQCWQQDPLARPTFLGIEQQLRQWRREHLLQQQTSVQDASNAGARRSICCCRPASRMLAIQCMCRSTCCCSRQAYRTPAMQVRTGVSAVAGQHPEC
jgi:hypothetical protein